MLRGVLYERGIDRGTDFFLGVKIPWHLAWHFNEIWLENYVFLSTIITGHYPVLEFYKNKRWIDLNQRERC